MLVFIVKKNNLKKKNAKALLNTFQHLTAFSKKDYYGTHINLQMCKIAHSCKTFNSSDTVLYVIL